MMSKNAKDTVALFDLGNCAVLRREDEHSHHMSVKSAADLAVGAVLLALLSPLMMLIAVAIWIESEGPPIFTQLRVGYRGQVFKIYKFRTMFKCGSDYQGGVQAKRNDARFTKVGRFLRRSSLDELPQLFNVLKGEMSMVGPRPHAIAHHLYYLSKIDGFDRRLLFKPGITGWAQVNGWRGETRMLQAMQKRVDYDLEYLTRWSIWLDVQIMLYTVLWFRWHSRNAY